MNRAVKLALGVTLVGAIAVTGWHAWYVSNLIPSNEPGPTQPPASPSKLVVMVVFDQMRGDYLTRWAESFGPEGFERIKKNGVWYSDCQLPYSCSSTGPGHASIATGAPPSVHGIIENVWYELASGEIVYCVQPSRKYDRVPPLASGPSEKLSRGSADGFSAEQMKAMTVGDALKKAKPTSRVFNLSIKDRTAAMMGGMNSDGVYCFDTRDGRFRTGSNYRSETHPWVTEFNASNRANDWFNQKWERFKPELDYKRLSTSDDPAPGEAYGYNKQSMIFPHPYAGDLKVPAKGYYDAVETSPAGNELLLDLTKKAIAAEKLGSSGTVDLLNVSFSSNDLIGHQWGPDSWEVLDVTLRSDDLVKRLIDSLDVAPGKGNYTLVITADHGICPLPEQNRLPSARRVPTVEVLTELALAFKETFGEQPGQITRWYADEASLTAVWPWLSLNKRAIEGRGLTVAEVRDYAAQWLGNRPYAMAAFTRPQIEAGQLPANATPELREVMKKVKLATYPGRGGDILFIPKPGVLVTDYPRGTSHGTPHAYDTHVPLLAYGAGIPALGQRATRVSSLTAAPIVAQFLGIDPPEGAKEPVPEELRR